MAERSPVLEDHDVKVGSRVLHQLDRVGTGGGGAFPLLAAGDLPGLRARRG